jgi:hypothetical protein
MERRDLLGAVATLGSVAVAGCSETSTPGGGDPSGGGGDESGGSAGGGNDGDGGAGSDDGGSGSDDGGNTDGDESGGSDDAELYIAQAVSTLNAVALRLNKVKDELDTPDEIDLDEQTLLDGIAEARGQLDSASETASDAQRAQIETLRHLATVLEEMTRVVGLVVDVDPDAAAADAKAAIDAEDYDQALSVVRDAKATATTVQERTTTAEDALEGVNPDRLAEVDGVEYAKVESAVTETAALADAFETLTVGYEASILGAQDLETGRTHSENERFDEARTAFANAKTHFGTAEETFSGSVEDAPDDIAARIEVATCQTTHLRKAAVAFEAAAEDADDGNLLDAKEHREDGEEHLATVDDCGN